MAATRANGAWPTRWSGGCRGMQRQLGPRQVGPSCNGQQHRSTPSERGPAVGEGSGGMQGELEMSILKKGRIGGAGEHSRVRGAMDMRGYTYIRVEEQSGNLLVPVHSTIRWSREVDGELQVPGQRGWRELSHRVPRLQLCSGVGGCNLPPAASRQLGAIFAPHRNATAGASS